MIKFKNSFNNLKNHLCFVKKHLIVNSSKNTSNKNTIKYTFKKLKKKIFIIFIVVLKKHLISNYLKNTFKKTFIKNISNKNIFKLVFKQVLYIPYPKFMYQSADQD